MNVTIILQLLLTGVAMGFIYGLIALGMNLIYNATGGLNFAQGALVVLGAYAGVTFSVTMKFPPILAAILAIAIMSAVGALFGFLVYEPLRYKNPSMFLLAAIGVGTFLTEVVQFDFAWGKIPYMVPRFISNPVLRKGSLLIDTQNLVIIVVATGCLVLLNLVLTKTQLGLTMRAVGQNKEVSSLMGIRVRHTIRLTFAASTVMATVAGVMAGPLFFVSPALSNLMTKGFAAAVIGGFGPRVYGVVVGGVIVGVVEAFAAYFLSSSYRDAWAFIFLIGFLLINPRGLFGEEHGEKA